MIHQRKLIVIHQKAANDDLCIEFNADIYLGDLL